MADALRIELTPEQVEQLQPLFDAARNAHTFGRTGMLVAQLLQDSPQRGHLLAGFLPHAKAKLLVREGIAPAQGTAADPPPHQVDLGDSWDANGSPMLNGGW